jgi:hypothetical protein
MLAAMLRLSEDAISELPVSTLGHRYEITIASFVAVTQGYWRSNIQDAKKLQVIHDLAIVLGDTLINTVYLESDNFQEEVRQDERAAFQNAEQEIAQCVRARIEEYLVEIDRVVDDRTGKTQGVGLTEALYRNLTGDSPIESCDASELKLRLLTSLAMPMILVFMNAMRCRF